MGGLVAQGRGLVAPGSGTSPLPKFSPPAPAVPPHTDGQRTACAPGAPKAQAARLLSSPRCLGQRGGPPRPPAPRRGERPKISLALSACRWTGELRRLRRTYPQYKMGIVHVTATWEHVVEREAKRGQITGRRIPPTLLALVYEQVPRAVKHLQRLVDLYVEVDNNGEQPRLRRPEDVLNFMRLCRQLQPAGAAEGRWRKQQRFAIWKYFDPADLND